MPDTPSLPSPAPPTVLRYSPRPIEAYSRHNRGRRSGPADSAMFDTTEIWNLAYLSHDFEQHLFHTDADFTVLVRRTAQTRLDGSGLDHAMLGTPAVVASLLRLPAPRFVALISRHPVLPSLPLFQRYGASWLEMMDRRSRLCRADIVDPAVGVDNDLSTYEPTANQVLARFRVVRAPPDV